jgi:VanZ family protein
MKHIHHIFWFWLPPLGYMAAIFGVSALPNPQIGGETPDYVLHALEYFLLALLLIRLLLAQAAQPRQSDDFQRWRAACLLGTLLAIAYGLTDEFHQYFVPNRHCSLHDVAADAFGALLAYTAALAEYWLLTRTALHRRIFQALSMFKSVSYLTYWHVK